MVVQSLEERFTVDPSSQILDLSNGGCTWKEHLFELEEEQGLAKMTNGTAESKKDCTLFIICTDQNGMWRIQCVPVRPSFFENRLSLPQS